MERYGIRVRVVDFFFLKNSLENQRQEWRMKNYLIDKRDARIITNGSMANKFLLY